MVSRAWVATTTHRVIHPPAATLTIRLLPALMQSHEALLAFLHRHTSGPRTKRTLGSNRPISISLCRIDTTYLVSPSSATRRSIPRCIRRSAKVLTLPARRSKPSASTSLTCPALYVRCIRLFAPTSSAVRHIMHARTTIAGTVRPGPFSTKT